MLSIIIFDLYPLSARAASVVIPNTTTSNATTSQNAASVSNPGSRKDTPPQLSLQFSSNDTTIKQGTEVTAEALTSGFSQQDSNLYFTWYLKHKGCDLTDSSQETKAKGENNCDLDGDGKITVNDWKIAAARIIVDGSFDNNGVDYSEGANSNYDPNASGVASVPSVTNKDGWITNFERKNNDDSNGNPFNCATDGDVNDPCAENSSDDSVPDCYVENISSGLTYELKKPGNSVFTPCPTGYHMACLNDATESCQYPNTDVNAGTGDIPKTIDWGADACNIQSEASSSEQCVECVDTNGNTSSPDSKGQCASPTTVQTSEPDSSGQCSSPSTLQPSTDAPGMSCDGPSNGTFSNTATCKNNGTPLCIPDSSYSDGYVNVNSNATETLASSGTSAPTTSSPLVYGTIWENNNVCSAATIDPLDSSKSVFSNSSSTDISTDTTNGSPYIWGQGNTTATPETYNPLYGTTMPYDANTSTPAILKGATCSQLANDLIGGVTATGSSNPGLTGIASLQPTCTISGGGNNDCKHLFPYFPSKSVIGADGKSISLNLEDKDVQGTQTPLDILGSGKFTLNEKEFWGADPTKISTNGVQPDEAAVMGLGVTKFSWQYADGDEIGVAVEGDSQQPTDHLDGSKKRMWAFSNNTCNALNDAINNGDADSSYYTETIPNGGGTVGIEVADFDPNDCLPENLIDPTKSNGLSNITVTLNSSEDQPIDNDSTKNPMGQGDNITINSSIGNASGDQKNMLYDWHVELSTDGSTAPTNTTQWKDITTDMQTDYGSFPASAETGVGKISFKFNLNLPFDYINGISPTTSDNGYFYLRINAKVSENEGQDSKNGNGTITLKVYEQKNVINVYTVSADENGILSPNDDNSGTEDEICNDAQDFPACQVVKDEVLALEVPNADQADRLDNFSWQVNGTSATCDPAFSKNCDPNDPNYENNLLFLPISGDDDGNIKVEATAINEKTNDHIIVDRSFQVVPYGVSITPVDATVVQPKILGYNIGLDGSKTADNSATNFLTSPGSTIDLKAQFTPSWFNNNASMGSGGQSSAVNYTWTVDGDTPPAESSFNETEFSFPNTKNIGENYNIGITANFTPAAYDPDNASNQLNNIRKALLNDWEITADDSIQQTAQANMQIDVVDPATISPDGSSSVPLGANLLSHVPEQVLFSVRIILTGFLLLFVTGLVFSFMPNYEEEKV